MTQEVLAMRSHHSWRVASAFVVLVFFAGCSENPTMSDVAPHVGDNPSFARGDNDILTLAAGGEPFADSEIFFEWNSTDDDLGVQVFLDGEDWNRVRIFNPMSKRIVDIQTKKEFGDLGITELRFESAEPSPAEVLALFSPGEYQFRGVTVDGEPLVGEGELSDHLAAPPVFTPGDGDVVDADDLTIEWSFDPEVESYEVIVVNEDSGMELFAEVPGDVTTLKIPENFTEDGAEYKAEVLAILENGNKTITEHVFYTAP
jgi:hypothetical protein